MRRWMKIGLVFAAGLVLGAAAGSWGQRLAYRRWMQRGPNPERILAKLQKKLDLDPSQSQAVKAVLEARAKAFKASREEALARLKTDRESAQAEIMKILRPDQRPKFEALIAESRRRHSAEETPH